MLTKVKCMGLPISSCSTHLIQVRMDLGFSVQSVSPAVGRCNVLACESMLCSVPLFLFSSVGLYYDSVYSTVLASRSMITFPFILLSALRQFQSLCQSEFCSLRSNASSFNFQYLLLS